jgi:hypothetical protein
MLILKSVRQSRFSQNLLIGYSLPQARTSPTTDAHPPHRWQIYRGGILVGHPTRTMYAEVSADGVAGDAVGACETQHELPSGLSRHIYFNAGISSGETMT